MAEGGRLVLTRPARGQTGTVRRIAVKVDGKVVARLRPGQSQVVEVSPGAHRVACRMDLLASRPVTVDLVEGQSVRVQVSLPFPQGLAGLFRPRSAVEVKLSDPDE